jgi:hypothetical protein
MSGSGEKSVVRKAKYSYLKIGLWQSAALFINAPEDL